MFATSKNYIDCRCGLHLIEYQKKDPISHCLDRPDMYVGSTRLRKIEEYVAEQKEDTKSPRPQDSWSPRSSTVSLTRRKFREMVALSKRKGRGEPRGEGGGALRDVQGERHSLYVHGAGRRPGGCLQLEHEDGVPVRRGRVGDAAEQAEPGAAVGPDH